MASCAPGPSTSIEADEAEETVKEGHVVIEITSQTPLEADFGSNRHTTKAPYQHRVKRLAISMKQESLRLMAAWMSMSWHESRVAIIERNPATTALASFQGGDGLKDALSAPERSASSRPDSLEDPLLRLLIVEDVSGDIVELLGSRFDINPFFFEDHFCSNIAWNFQQKRLQRLVATRQYDQWFQIRSVELKPDPHPTWSPEEINSNARNTSNLPRPIQRIYGRRGGNTVLVRETQTTIWIGDDPTCPNTTIGIVLLDTSSYSNTDQHGYSILSSLDNSMPDIHSISSSARMSQTSSTSLWYDDIVETTCHSRNDNAAIVCPTIYKVCAEWLSICAFVNEVLDVNDRLLYHGSAIEIDGALINSEPWRLHVRRWREMVSETLEQVLPTAARLTLDCNRSNGPDKLETITLDFRRVLHKLDTLEARINRIFDRGTAEMQLAAARQSLAESQNLARLTWLATIFIPLTFVTGLFSMTEDLGSLSDTFKTYFEAAVPVVVGSFIIARWGYVVPFFVRAQSSALAKSVVSTTKIVWRHIINTMS